MRARLQRRGRGEAEPASAATAGRTRPDLVTLQRRAGNQAVLHLVRGRRDAAPVQRWPEETGFEPAPTSDSGRREEATGDRRQDTAHRESARPSTEESTNGVDSQEPDASEPDQTEGEPHVLATGEVNGRTYVITEGEGFVVGSGLLDSGDVASQVTLPQLPATSATCDEFPQAVFGGLAVVEAFAQRLADEFASREAPVAARRSTAQAKQRARRAAAAERVRGERPRDRRARIQAAVDAVPEPDVAILTSELSAARFDWLRQDFDATVVAARRRFGARCVFTEVVQGWLVARREQVDFQTGMREIRSLQGFGAPAAADGESESLVALEPLGSGPPVMPITVEFLEALRNEAGSFRASNYRGHGGGSFKNRGLSLDLYISASKDERGFWDPDAAVAFLLAVDRAAAHVSAGWRVLYDDFRVARAVNRSVGVQRVRFQATVDSGGRLNWHGPLVLHFHLDLMPPTRTD